MCGKEKMRPLNRLFYKGAIIERRMIEEERQHRVTECDTVTGLERIREDMGEKKG